MSSPRRQFLQGVGATVTASLVGCLENRTEKEQNDQKGPLEARWTRDIDYLRSISVGDERVYHGALFSLGATDRRSGENSWNEQLYPPSDATCYEGTFTVHEELLLAGDCDRCYAFERKTGERRWTNENIGSTYSPALTDEYVYFSGHQVAALRIDDGSTAWTSHVDGDATDGGPSFTELTAASGTVYVGSSRGNVHALDGRTGTVTWSTDTDGHDAFSPVVSGDTLYVGVLTDESDDVFALDRESGTVRWQSRLGTFGVGTRPVPHGEYVFANDRDAMYALDAADGSTAWKTPVDGEIRTDVAVGGDALYVGGKEYLYAFDSATGDVRWRHSIDSSASVVEATNGVLYAGFDDTLHSFEMQNDQT